MPSKAIIVRLERHLDHHGRLTLCPPDLPQIPNQASSGRQLLQEMASRRKVNQERREQEFNQLRALMLAKRNSALQISQGQPNPYISNGPQQVVDRSQDSQRTTKQGSSDAWWNRASAIALSKAEKKSRQRDSTFPTTLPASEWAMA